MTAYNEKTEDQSGRQITPIVGNSEADGSGTSYFPRLTSAGALLVGTAKTVSVEKVLAAASAYDAEDVLSEDADNGEGTAWTFAAIARANAGKGYITKVQVISETTAITPRLVVFFFNATPTSELDDHAANTSPVYADAAKFIGMVELPALSDVGTGVSSAVASPSTAGNLPLEFECASDADDLIAVVATKDAFTQGAGKKLTIKVTVEQY